MRISSQKVRQLILVTGDPMSPELLERIQLFKENGEPIFDASQGPAGPAGPTGPTGPAGTAGTAGATGATGATGPTGPQGPKGDKGDTGLQGPAGTGGSSASVSSDTIWDSKGDLAVATGADAASKLSVGSNNQVLTADSAQATGVKWSTPVSSGGAKLFDQTLVADALSIDTGAGGIPSGYGVLDVFVYGRTDEAALGTECYVRLNADSGANYDWQRISGNTVSIVASNVVADNGWDGFVSGGNSAANTFGMIHLVIPAYDSTAGFKAGRWTDGFADGGGASGRIAAKSGTWRNTGAITRLSVQAAFSGTVKFKAGSRMMIYGRG